MSRIQTVTATSQSDITIKQTGAATATGYILAGDQRRAWSIRPAPQLPAKMRPGTRLRYQQFATDIATVWAQDNWDKGLGYSTFGPANAFDVGQNVMTVTPRQVTLAPLVTSTASLVSGSEGPVAMIAFGTQLFMIGWRYVWERTAAPNTWTQRKDFGAAGSCTSAVYFDGYMYATVGDVINRSTDGITWVTGSTATSLLVVANNRLYQIVNSQSVAPTIAGVPAGSNPYVAGFGAVTTIGTTARYVSAAVEYQGALILFKADGLYAMDETGRFDLIARMFFQQNASLASTGGGIWPVPPGTSTFVDDGLVRSWRTAVCNGALYFCANRSIWRYTPGLIEKIGPEDLPGFPADPAWKALATDQRYVYAAEHSGAIYCFDPVVGRWSEMVDYSTYDSNTSPWLLGVLPQNVLTDTVPRLYCFDRATSTNIIRQSQLPRTHNVLDESGFPFAATGLLRETIWTANLPDQRKGLLAMAVWADQITATETILVEYQQVDVSSGTWTTLGTVSATNISGGRAVLSFPTTSNGIRARRVQFRFTLARGGTTTLTPVLKAWALYYAVLSDAPKMIEATVKVEQGVTLRNGQVETRTAATIKAALWAYRNTVQTITGPDGTAYTCLIKRVSEQETAREKDRESEHHVTVRAVEWTAGA